MQAEETPAADKLTPLRPEPQTLLGALLNLPWVAELSVGIMNVVSQLSFGAERTSLVGKGRF